MYNSIRSFDRASAVKTYTGSHAATTSFSFLFTAQSELRCPKTARHKAQVYVTDIHRPTSRAPSSLGVTICAGCHCSLGDVKSEVTDAGRLETPRSRMLHSKEETLRSMIGCTRRGSYPEIPETVEDSMGKQIEVKRGPPLEDNEPAWEGMTCHLIHLSPRPRTCYDGAELGAPDRRCHCKAPWLQ